MEITVRQLEPADAPLLVDCFERCYGATYPNATFYDAAAIAGRITRGALKSVIALGADGAIVGHTGLTVRHPGAGVVEAGNTIVDPACRGAGILGRLGAALADLCRQSGYLGYVHYPTTAHEVMQKRSVTNGGTETGIMLGYVPAATDYRGIERPVGRIAATVVYQPFAPGPLLDVVVPERYAVLLGRLYGSMGLARRRQRTHSTPHGATAGRHTFNPRRGLLHVHVEHIGSDLQDHLGALPGHAAEITQVDLMLDEPGIGRAVDDLVELGFFYCGLLPGFARSDVLRMQQLRDQPPEVYAPPLANPGARSLLSVIDADRAA